MNPTFLPSGLLAWLGTRRILQEGLVHKVLIKFLYLQQTVKRLTVKIKPSDKLSTGERHEIYILR